MADTQQQIDDLERDLRGYPPLRAWAHACEENDRRRPGSGLEIKSPLLMLGDRALLALLALKGDINVPDLSDADGRLRVAGIFLQSTPVLWPRAFVMTAHELALPKHVVAYDVMPYPNMWWELSAPLGGADGEEFASILLIDDRQSERIMPMLIGVGSSGTEVVIRSLPDIPIGASWPDDFPEDARGNVELVLQMLAFMNSRFIADTEDRLPRPDRRAIARAVAKGETSITTDAVRVVRLRSTESIDHGAIIGAGSDPDRWSHRWLVRGHYRAQWYPSIQSHRVRWIAPFMKGPADKPFVPPIAKVVR